MLNKLYSSVRFVSFHVSIILGTFVSAYTRVACLVPLCVHYLTCLIRNDSAQSMAKIEELLQEDQNVKRRRERYQKQSSILSKLTRQLSIHDNRAAAASSYSNGVGSGNIS